VSQTAGLDGRDVFISHAGEDKLAVATPLAAALISRGWSVWLDELELTVGDSLNTRISAALARSRFGVVVLSPAFFAKRWPQRELDGLAAREVASGTKVILPVWHGVDSSWLAGVAPILADRVGVSTALGIEHVADKLVQALESARESQTAGNDSGAGMQSVLVAAEDIVASRLNEGSQDPLALWWRLPKVVSDSNAEGGQSGRTAAATGFAVLRMAIPLAYTRNYRRVAKILAEMARLDVAKAGAQVADPGAPANRPTMIAALRQMAHDDPGLLATILREAFELQPRDVVGMCYEAGLPVPEEEFTARFLRTRSKGRS
jgi:hypothetical protein